MYVYLASRPTAHMGQGRGKKKVVPSAGAILIGPSLADALVTSSIAGCDPGRIAPLSAREPMLGDGRGVAARLWSSRLRAV